ncbi:hypothetical protein R20943_00592 [Paraburkholderia aspalathi]|nr:hypothetical protein R20943_00592 [Paraburkholderia aspalathi]
MAIYKYPQFLQQGDDVLFDKVWSPGGTAPLSGIYRCEGCGITIVSTRGHTLPPQNHHQHTVAQGAIRWQPIVKTHF